MFHMSNAVESTPSMMQNGFLLNIEKGVESERERASVGEQSAGAPTIVEREFYHHRTQLKNLVSSLETSFNHPGRHGNWCWN